MRILVACEFSGIVRSAFRRQGHDAWSCDLPPALDGSPYHLKRDVLGHLGDGWDLMIAHPPCDRLLVSGALHWHKWRSREMDFAQQRAIVFFMSLALAPIPRIAIENPKGIMNTVWRPPDQWIHPWQYGHMETKETCIWLKGLPCLMPTDDVHEAMMRLPPRKRNRVHHESPGVKNGLTRSQRRSIFFPGWADAMASQWGTL